MPNALMSRLEAAMGKLLENNQQLQDECRTLKQEQIVWQQERAQLLAEVEQILERLDALQLEDS